MKLKSYFADSVEAAMDQAARELGHDAMLVYSRQSPPEARHLGAYEVVIGVPPEDEPRAQSAHGRPAPAFTAGAHSVDLSRDAAAPDTLHQQVADLRRLVGRLASVMARNGSSQWCRGPLADQMQCLTEELLAAKLGEELVQRVMTRLREHPDLDSFAATPDPVHHLRVALRDELTTMFEVDSSMGASLGGPRVVAIVGPPGAGKTTSIVKLAANYTLRARKPAQLLSVDMYRVGAAEQLRSFAAILGIGFQALDTTAALAQALTDHRHKDLVLIDTPGHSERDIDASEDLAVFLQSCTGIDVHLALPASMKAADMARAVARYQRFRPTKLIFTKLDETTSPGTVLNEAIRSAIPVSFLGTGQQIPEDLLEATQEAILCPVLGIRPAAAAVPLIRGEKVTVSAPLWGDSIPGRAAAA